MTKLTFPPSGMTIVPKFACYPVGRIRILSDVTSGHGWYSHPVKSRLLSSPVKWLHDVMCGGCWPIKSRNPTHWVWRRRFWTESWTISSDPCSENMVWSPVQEIPKISYSVVPYQWFCHLELSICILSHIYWAVCVKATRGLRDRSTSGSILLQRV